MIFPFFDAATKRRKNRAPSWTEPGVADYFLFLFFFLFFPEEPAQHFTHGIPG